MPSVHPSDNFPSGLKIKCRCVDCFEFINSCRRPGPVGLAHEPPRPFNRAGETRRGISRCIVLPSETSDRQSRHSCGRLRPLSLKLGIPAGRSRVGQFLGIAAEFRSNGDFRHAPSRLVEICQPRRMCLRRRLGFRRRGPSPDIPLNLRHRWRQPPGAEHAHRHMRTITRICAK